MQAGTKDVAFCPQGKHIVPAEDMTKMLSDNGKQWRRVCINCKNATLERRAKMKAKR